MNRDGSTFWWPPFQPDKAKHVSLETMDCLLTSKILLSNQIKVIFLKSCLRLCLCMGWFLGNLLGFQMGCFPLLECHDASPGTEATTSLDLLNTPHIQTFLIPGILLRTLINTSFSNLHYNLGGPTTIILLRDRWGHSIKAEGLVTCVKLSGSEGLHFNSGGEQVILAVILCRLSTQRSHKLLPEHNWYYAWLEKNFQS